MRGTHLRCAAVLAGLVLTAACTLPSGAAAPSPSPRPAAAPSAPPAAWSIHLDLAGDLSGTVREVAASQPGRQNECTGQGSAGSGAWASTVYGLLGGDVYALLVYIPTYSGPGRYGSKGAEVQFYDPPRTRVWESQAGGAVQVTIDLGQMSGRVTADLPNLVSGSGTLHLSGTWSCG